MTGAALTGIAAPSLVSAAEPALQLEYVAMGDSYHSGEGTPPFTAGTDTAVNGCRRSTQAAAALLAADSGRTDIGLRLKHVACSGARIDNIFQGQYTEPPQLQALSGTTDLITISIGGNNAGFADILGTCGDPRKAHTCWRGLKEKSATELKAYRNLDSFTLPERRWGGVSYLEHVHRVISVKAPNAKLLIVGYPRFFPSGDKTLCGGFTEESQAWLNEGVDELNRRIAQTAQRVGAKFVSVAEAFEGHGPCEPSNENEWINAKFFGDRANDSFHPNLVGQKAIAREMRNALQHLNFTKQPPVATPTVSPSPSLAPTPPSVTGPLEIASQPTTAVAGAAFAGAYTARGGTPPYTWWNEPLRPIPAGLTLAEDGRVTGTPIISGLHRTQVTVTDAKGATVTALLTFEITLASPQTRLVLVNESGGFVWFVSPYCIGSKNTHDLGAAGGTAPYTWARGAEWPEGLDLAPNGRLTGNLDYYRGGPQRADVILTDALGSRQEAQLLIAWALCT